MEFSNRELNLIYKCLNQALDNDLVCMKDWNSEDSEDLENIYWKLDHWKTYKEAKEDYWSDSFSAQQKRKKEE